MSMKARAEQAEARLAKVRAVVESLRVGEDRSMWAQGESPRPLDYSEGHYTGHRAGIRYAIDMVDAALTSGDGQR